MLEPRSALYSIVRPGRFGVARPEGPGVLLSEIRGRYIVQVAAWPGTFDAVVARAGSMVGAAGAAIRVGAERLWLIGEMPGTAERLRAAFGEAEAVVLDISHSRVIVRADGPEVRRVLAKGIPIDLHDDAFPAGTAAQTVVEQTGVLVHRVGRDRFDLYVARSYAACFWHWLTENAAEIGYEVR